QALSSRLLLQCPCRSLPAASGQSTSEGRARAHTRCERQAKRGDSSHDTGICPICSGHFSLDLLAHTSCCGEEDPNPAWPSSLRAEASCNTWVCCPICDTCEEQAGTPGTLASSYHLG
uniref:Uncharacterized protein n=1 Tax=Falco tinnunculus TaxID=100819 RepID=A0A8C4XRP9_FALTI